MIINIGKTILTEYLLTYEFIYSLKFYSTNHITMSTGFLITNFSGQLKRIREIVNQHVLKKLYIYVSFNKTPESIKNSEWVSEKIIDLYSSSFRLFPNLDVRIILNDLKLYEEKLTKFKDYNIDIVIMPKNFDVEKISDFKNYLKNLYVVYIDGVPEEDDDDDVRNNSRKYKVYNNVVLGGTFDRLHTGHKILLSEALLRCTNKLTVGVTDGDMIKSKYTVLFTNLDKKLWELIEPCSKRISAVKEFIKEVDGGVDCNVVPITDMYGPTKKDSKMKMIVVSSETKNGAHKINEMRIKNRMNDLDIHVVNLIQGAKKTNEEEEKISSSNLRMRLLGSYLKRPEEKPNLPCKPYVIGLTGGIASGKSTICDYLKTLGAAIVDCDKIGHQLYKPKTKIYNEVINTFGKEIVSDNGEIDRKALGGMVFNDQTKLDQLNNLMWPAIYEAAREECERLYKRDNIDIVILEAAVLLRAGWHKNVHEVWATIIPPEEAVTRLMNRNNLTEEEGKKRINSQPSNAEIVEIANIVFCSMWAYEFTRKQVDKAWSAVNLNRKTV